MLSYINQRTNTIGNPSASFDYENGIIFTSGIHYKGWVLYHFNKGLYNYYSINFMNYFNKIIFVDDYFGCIEDMHDELIRSFNCDSACLHFTKYIQLEFDEDNDLT